MGTSGRLLLLVHGAHSPWNSFPLAPSPQRSPLSGVANGAIYGGKAWQMQESSAKSLDAFSPQHCQQWHLAAWLAPLSALKGWGALARAWPELCEALVGQSVSKQPPKILSHYSPFHSQRGRGQRQDFVQTHSPYPFCALPSTSPGSALSQQACAEAGQFSIKFS